MAVAVAWANEEGVIEYANPKFTEMFGYTVEDVSTVEQWYLCAYPDANYRKKIMTLWEADVVKARQENVAIPPMELNVTCKDGSVRNVILAGSWAGPRLLATFSDITEKAGVEKTLRFVAQRGWAVKGEAFIPAIVRYLAEMFAVDYAFVGRLRMNKASIESIAFYAKGQLVENFQYDLINTPCANVVGQTSCIYPSDVQKLFPQDYFLTEMGVDSYAGIPLWDSKGDGLGILTLLHSSPLNNIEVIRSQLQLVAVRVAAELERKKTDDEIKDLNTSLEDRVQQRTRELSIAKKEADLANQAKSEFLSSMSHELRTPMNAILGFSQLMGLDDDLAAEQKDNLREIRMAGEHLLELINDVLDLSKVESGHLEFLLESVAVRPVIEECLGMVASLADKNDIQTSHSCSEGIIVCADRRRLKQVIINLLSNAIKYNRRGGSVTLALKPEPGERLRILVTDTGPGIAKARQAELFQPFNRLDAENSEIEGTGIGLTLTRRIVEMMGGTVDLESQEGVGSTFWIELALESPVKSQAKQVDDNHETKQLLTLANTEQHKVLYIDDNAGNLKLVKQIFKYSTHIKLLTAHTPVLGIELAKTQQPELIFLDIHMPGMDGYQVLEVFKADNSLKNIPVIAVTAYAMERDIEAGKAAGFSDYITKPMDVTYLRILIDQLLGGAVK